MNELERLTSSIDFSEPYNAKGHKDIYDAVDDLPQEDASSTRPPPSLVFYAARNMLSPSFILGQIPDLLDLLALVESFRQFAVLKSDEAIEWHTYYEREQRDGREGGVRLLASNELHELRRFLNQKDAQRREYVVLIRSLVQLYIHYLWTAPESCLLWKRLNDFFPGSIEGVDSPSELFFHNDLSEDEKAYFERLKVECREWLCLVADWDEKREHSLEQEGISREDIIASFADDFRDAFPQPCEPLDMARNVEIYMNKVEYMVQKLKQWFPPLSMG